MAQCACGSFAINDDPTKQQCDACLWATQASEALNEVAALRKQLAQTVKTLVLIEQGTYENGEYLDRNGMQSFACNTLVEIGEERAMTNTRVRGDQKNE